MSNRKKVWIVVDATLGREDMVPLAACFSLEQAAGVAASLTVTEGPDTVIGEVFPQSIELWEPDDGIPTWFTLHQCVLRDNGYPTSDPGKDLTYCDERNYATDQAPQPTVHVRSSGDPSRGGFIEVWAKDFPTQEEAKQAAVAAYLQARDSAEDKV